MPPITKLPCPRDRKDIAIPHLLDQLQRFGCRKTRIRLDDHLLHPTRRHELLQHLPKQLVLMALLLRINHRDGDRHAKPFPTGDQ